jgi:sugar lactone lactonase YvrE
VQLSSAGLALTGDMAALYADDVNSDGWQINNNPLGGASWPLSPEGRINESYLTTGGMAGGMVIHGEEMWVVDIVNRELVHVDLQTNAMTVAPGPEAATLPDPDATPGSAPPVVQPLVAPLSIAWDTTRSYLYVSDVGNMCIRKFDVARRGWYPDALRWTYPSMPRGVSVDRTHGCVWTADALNLWGYYVDPTTSDNPPAWFQFPLPDKLKYKVAGLHYNDLSTPALLWIVTTDGQLWSLYHQSDTVNTFTNVVTGQ